MKEKKIRKILIIILLLILLSLVLLFIDIDSYKEYTSSYFYFDTYISVKTNTIKSEKEMDNIFDDIDYLYESYHKLTDAFNSYDNLINIYYLNNILEDNQSIELDTRLSTIIKIGLEYYDKTNGLFNIVSGNLTIIWKQYLEKCDSIPSSDELDVNIDINDINLENNLYTKNNGIKLDLGALAKGYVTQLIGEYLEENNINSYIINAGGNVKVGKAYDKSYYVVGITNPDNTSNIFTKVNVNNLSIVTSGNYQRNCIIDNVNYNHIINPNTSYPSNYIKSVTVISSDSLLADIYSTYLFLLPVDQGLEIVNSINDIEAIWYIDENNIVRSDNFNYE